MPVKSITNSTKNSGSSGGRSQTLSDAKSPKAKDSSFRSITSSSTKRSKQECYDSKNFIGDQINKTEPCRMVIKENSQPGSDSFLNSGVDPTSPSMSTIHPANDDGRDVASNMYNEKYCKKVLEEMSGLRKEVEQKNSIIEKLMKENAGLRNEMEEFISAVDEAREYIDVELKECNLRIQGLEAEIEELRRENRHYKEELLAAKKSIPSVEVTKDKDVMSHIEEEVEGFNTTTQQSMEAFYFKLNEQIAEFMNLSKKQYEDFSKNIQTKIQDAKKETTVLKANNSKTSISAYQGSLSPKKSPSRHRLDRTPKSSGMIKKNSSKKSLDRFLSQANEVPTGVYSLYNSRSGYDSNTHLEGAYEENMEPQGTGEYERGKKSVSFLASPKSSILRTKLKSDAILQEMKKRLNGGVVNV